jgi:hypothetical protein
MGKDKDHNGHKAKENSNLHENETNKSSAIAGHSKNLA